MKRYYNISPEEQETIITIDYAKKEAVCYTRRYKMANEQNLIPLNKRSQRERKEIAIKGANASNKIQKQKKQIKQQFEMLMSLDIQDETLKEQITSLGIPVEEMTLQMALCVSIMQQALQGNIKAFELIQNTLGQNPMKELGNNEEHQTVIFINDIKEMENLNVENDNN